MPNGEFTGEQSVLLRRLYVQFRNGYRGTVKDLAKIVFSTTRGLDASLKILHGCGLARIVGWKLPVGAGGMCAIWEYGPGEHEPRPRRSVRHVNPAHSLACQRIAAYLAEHPYTGQREIADHAHCAYGAMPRYLRALRDAGMAHIGRWTREKSSYGASQPRPLYCAGPGRDAQKPRAIPASKLGAKRRRDLAAKFGEENAKRIMTCRKDGGPDVLSFDGVIWRRRPYRVQQGEAA